MSNTTSVLKRSVRLAIAGVLVAAFAAATTSTSTVTAGGKKDESQVKFTATGTKPDKDGLQKITITMDINSGYYAYANKVMNEDLEPVQTIVKIAGAQSVDYPAGKKKSDMGTNYMIYEGKVEINATVKRAAGDTGPLDVTVKYSVCSVKGFCLPPEQVKLQVK